MGLILAGMGGDWIPMAEAAPTFSVPGFVDETLYQGNGMISMRFDYAGRLWVVEKQGRVLVFPPPSPNSASIGAPTVFADLSGDVEASGETGMTGFALDPNFQTNRYLYVLYATNDAQKRDQRIVRLTANAGFTADIPASRLILLSGLPNTNTVHKAGDMHFHPSDPANLYVALGDDTERYHVSEIEGQYAYNGKILKISAADGKGLLSNPYTINGDVNSSRSRIFSAAYRNPYRFTFDPVTNGDYIYVSENGDGTDRLSRIEKGADGAWPTSGYLTNSADGKRMVLHTSDPSKTGVAIFRSGPFAPGGNPVIYQARYGGGVRNEVRRWTLTGTNGNAITPVAADNGNAFYREFTDHGIVSFTAGPDGFLYYTDSNQGESLGNNYRLGRIRFVGGSNPVADFSANPVSGQAPLNVAFTDSSTAPGSTISSRSWDFGDGSTSAQQNPSHTFTQPGIYTVSLDVTNALGLTHEKQSTVTVYHQTNITLTGQVSDGRGLPATALAAATELRFYQKDGTTPLAVSGGSGANGNILPVAGGGVINATFTAQLTGDGLVVSAGESASDGVEAAFVGIPISTGASSQSASANFYLSDTMLRGRSLDTKGVPAQTDIGVSRGAAGSYYAFAGGRDFLGASGIPASNQNHRTVPDAFGYYHVPIRTGGGNATIYLDTSADTQTSVYGKVATTAAVGSGVTVVKNLTVGLYNGGTNETDLSGIAVTPNVNFTTQIQPIFTTYCIGCHAAGATNSFGLNLEEGFALSQLVEHESGQAPGVKRVKANSPARSYLMEKLSAATPQVGTSMRPGDPMSPAQQALIRDWISQLTPPDLNAPPEIDSALTKSGVVSAPLTYQITALNLPAGFGASNLPPGLSLNGTTGIISGAPLAAGTFSSTITATNGNGTDTETLVFTITAGPPPAISSPLTASGTAGTPFTYTITAANNPASFGATGLPAGFSFNTSTGVISGTHAGTGTYSVAISATNANGTDTKNLALAFVANLSLNKGATAQSFQGGNEVAKGNDGSDATRWAAADGSYPQWWRVDLGEPKLVSRVDIKWYAGRTYRYRIEVSSNDTGYTQVADKTANTVADFTSDSFTPGSARYVRITVTGGTGFASFLDAAVFGTDIPTVAAPVITSTLTATGTTGLPFSYQIVATNTPTGYGATSLPTGLSVNAGNGLISGTPTASGAFNVGLSATNAGGTDIKTLVLTLFSPGVISFSGPAFSVQEGAANTTATITVQRTGGTAGAVDVTVSTASGGTATAGSDYTTVSTVLNWGSGDAADKTFTVPILSDSLAEGNETVALQLASPTGGATLGSQAAATLTIQDRPFDTWRHQAFAGQANTPQAQPLADFDNDGVSNLVEYALNSNPASNDGNIAPSVTVGSGNKLQIAFSRNLQAGGLIYRVVATNALESGAWEVLATKTGVNPWATAPGVLVSDDPDTGAVLVTDSASIINEGKRFLRVIVERTTD